LTNIITIASCGLLDKWRRQAQKIEALSVCETSSLAELIGGLNNITSFHAESIQNR